MGQPGHPTSLRGQRSGGSLLRHGRCSFVLPSHGQSGTVTRRAEPFGAPSSRASEQHRRAYYRGPARVLRESHMAILTCISHRSQWCRGGGDRWPMLCAPLVTLVLMAAMADAADTNQLSKSSGDLDSLTLEQLVNVQVTSVSRKEEKLDDAAAAIFVL